MINIEINDAERGENLIFNDEASAIVWLQDEIERWEDELGPQVPESPTAITQPMQRWLDIKRRVDLLRLDKFQSVSKEISFNNKDYGKLVRFEPNIGKALIFVFKRSGSLAASAAAISEGLASGEFNWNDDIAFRGIITFDWIKRTRLKFEAEQKNTVINSSVDKNYERLNEIDGTIEKLAKMVTSLAGTATQQREHLNAEFATSDVKIKEKWNSIEAVVENLENDIGLKIGEFESRIELTKKEAQTKIDSWIAAQDEQRQLEKPAELWAERGRSHLGNAKSWRSWAMGVGVAGLVLAVCIAVSAFQWARPLFEAATLPGTPASIKAGAGTIRPTFHYELVFTGAITLAWLTMYLWAMRVLVRLYTTEHHLAIDASARGAMMETYLGLIEADAANAADRPIVLQALFRPVQDGMVRDDGPPGMTPAAVLSALATSQAK